MSLVASGLLTGPVLSLVIPLATIAIVACWLLISLRREERRR